jgi:hypothetical protein
MSRHDVPPIAPLPTDYSKPYVTVWVKSSSEQARFLDDLDAMAENRISPPAYAFRVVVVQRSARGVETIADGFGQHTFRECRPDENPVYMAQTAAHLLALPCAIRATPTRQEENNVQT